MEEPLWTGERGSERSERCTMEKHIFILKILDAAKNTMLGLEFVAGIFNRKDKGMKYDPLFPYVLN